MMKILERNTSAQQNGGKNTVKEDEVLSLHGQSINANRISASNEYVYGL